MEAPMGTEQPERAGADPLAYALRIVIALLMIVVLSLLRAALPSLIAVPAWGVFLRPLSTEYVSSSENVMLTEDKRAIARDDGNVKLLAFGMPFKKNRDYFVQFEVVESRCAHPMRLHVDFYNGPDYDGGRQEHTVVLTDQDSGRSFDLRFNSGPRAPKKGQLRLFSREPGEYEIRNVQIHRASGVFHAIKTSLLMLILVLALYVIQGVSRITSPNVKHIAAVFVFSYALAHVIPHHLMRNKPYIVDNDYYGVWGDTSWVVPTALSILGEGNTDLNEYPATVAKARGIFSLVEQDGRFYDYFPIGQALISLPPIWFFNIVSGNAWWKTEFDTSGFLYAALNSMFFLFAFSVSNSVKKSYLLTLILAMATTNLTLITHVLSSHGGVELMCVVAMLSIYAGTRRQNPFLLVVSAIPLALAYITRPTASVIVVVWSAYMFFHQRKWFGAFALVGALVAAIFMLYSFRIYGDFLPPYFRATRLSFDTFFVALLGQSFSPNRGLFVFTPIYIFSMLGICRILRTREDPFMLFVAITPLPYFFTLAMFWRWWGGNCYGPRLFSDVAPFFVLSLLPCVNRLDFRRRKAYSCLFVTALALSMVVQLRGATSYAAWSWNSTQGSQDDVDCHPERVWDWKDMQIFRR